MTTYHEVSPSRRYEFRTFEDCRFTAWLDAGPASVETLSAIKSGMSTADHYEIRQTCALADETGSYVGELIFSELVHRQEPEVA